MQKQEKFYVGTTVNKRASLPVKLKGTQSLSHWNVLLIQHFVGQCLLEVVVIVEKSKYNVGIKISPQLRQGPTTSSKDQLV
jgi:hypothetical protein